MPVMLLVALTAKIAANGGAGEREYVKTFAQKALPCSAQLKTNPRGVVLWLA